MQALLQMTQRQKNQMLVMMLEVVVLRYGISPPYDHSHLPYMVLCPDPHAECGFARCSLDIRMSLLWFYMIRWLGICLALKLVKNFLAHLR